MAGAFLVSVSLGSTRNKKSPTDTKNSAYLVFYFSVRAFWILRNLYQNPREQAREK
jgi:hypothetical protein